MPCQSCQNPRVDELIAAAVPLRAIARATGYSRTALAWHRARHYHEPPPRLEYVPCPDCAAHRHEHEPPDLSPEPKMESGTPIPGGTRRTIRPPVVTLPDRVSAAWQRIDALWQADMGRLQEVRQQAPSPNLKHLGYFQDEFGQWVPPGTNRL